VPALVAYALCQFLKKKSNPGIEALKKVSSADFQLENAHYFERAWLMMADAYISQKDFNSAQ